MAILIENGLVVTGAPGGTRHEPGSLLLEGERIAWIGPAGEEPPAARAGGVEVIDARRSIVLPGLINAHMHSNEGFEQGCYDGLPLELWLLESYPPFDLPELSERQHYLRTMVCALQSIRSGVTTVQDDLLVVGSTPAPVDGAVKAYTDAGLRAVVTVAMWDRPFLDCLPWLRELVPTDLQLQLDRLPAANAKDQVASFERHHRTWQGHADRIRVVPAPSGPQRCSDDLLCAAADLSARHDLPVHIHVLETKAQAVTGLEFYGKTLVAHLDSVGLLTPRLTMNHAIWLTEADIAILGERGCSISHNPLSNQKLASGICPVHELLAAGVNVALGTDGLATSDTGDLIAALRAGSLLHKLRGHAPGGWIGAEQVFRMATAGGARSVGLESDAGSLEVGRRADVILLDRDDWGFIPLNDPIRQLAFSVTSEAVRTSIIGGRVVMRDRVITTLDEAAVKAEVQELAERFRREWRPRMHDGAGRVAPYVRAAYERATAMALPDLPQRMLPEPKAAPLGKARP
jgi:5-methylthioadenosine/S-adenosylhomocysteine deaminase